MNTKKKRGRAYRSAALILMVNLLAISAVGVREVFAVRRDLTAHGEQAVEKVQDVMEDYLHSFRLFVHEMSGQIEAHPDPDYIWDYLKRIDPEFSAIEGKTFDGLYMYYQGRYLYSWDTPYSQYEDTGYVATERPWYKDAVAGGGGIVFTPPYMSYANHYILSTVSQLQPDGETVFAYDIKMGDIQDTVASLNGYDGELMLVFDENGTVIGSGEPDYLGGNLYASTEETEVSLKEAQAALSAEATGEVEAREKLEEQVKSAEAFHQFRGSFGRGMEELLSRDGSVMTVKLGSRTYLGYLRQGGLLGTLTLVPVLSMLGATVQVWLLPLLVFELLLIYAVGRIVKEQKNRELRAAYVELGQVQERLRIALSAAQKAAAIDDLTGMMNFKSFCNSVTERLDLMGPDERGILIMLDGDHFKAINDNYGHTVGDEVIKLCAQMIVGRIRTVDLASRLHGDEFSIFVVNTEDYGVARRIVEDINATLKTEAARRNIPTITLSAGAVNARAGDSYNGLAKAADAALYRAKETHSGGFKCALDSEREI